MKELRVALFTGNYNHIRDGVSLTLNRLVSFLENEGIPVLIFGPSVKNPALKHCGEFVVTPSIPMLVKGRSEYRITTTFPDEAKKRLEEFNPTIVHLATPDSLGFAAMKWAQSKGVQVVSSYHTHFTSYFKYYKLDMIEFLAWRYLNWFYKQCAHVYVPSQSMIDELVKEGIEADMKIWARGVDNELFNPAKRDLEWRRKVGFGDDEIVVTFVSRLVWEKELGTFIETVRRVQKKIPKVRALIVGDGPAKEEAQSLLPQAHFEGFVKGEQLAKAYASSDVFLFPSHTETFGNVTLEAMASGLPCLVADAIGSKSLVENGKNGFWAEQESVKDFTIKLEQIVSDVANMRAMGIKSRELSNNYDWQIINTNLIDNYRNALKKPVQKLNF